MATEFEIDPKYNLLQPLMQGQPDLMAGLVPYGGLPEPSQDLPITGQPITPAAVGPESQIGFFEGLGVMATQVPSMFTATIPQIFQQTWRAFTQDMTLEDQTELDRMIRANEEERERARRLTPEQREQTWLKVPFTDIEIKAGDLESAMDSIGYSIANIAATLAGQTVGKMVPKIGPYISPVVGFAAGTAVTGGAMYDEFMGQMRDLFLQKYAPDGNVTPELEAKWAELRDELAGDARWYGFWEAAPETVGNQLMLRLGAAGKMLKKPAEMLINKTIKNQIARKIGQQVAKKIGIPATQLAAMLTEESITEMVTAKKQGDIEYQNGLRDKPLTYGEALKEVLPMVLVTTPLLGGGMTVAQSVFSKRAKGQQPTPTEEAAMDIINEGRKDVGLPPMTEEEALQIPEPDPMLSTQEQKAEKQKALVKRLKEIDMQTRVELPSWAESIRTPMEEDAAWSNFMARVDEEHFLGLREQEKAEAAALSRQWHIEQMRRQAAQRGPQDPALRELARMRETPLWQREEADRARIEKRRDELVEENPDLRDKIAQVRRQDLLDLYDTFGNLVRPVPVTQREIKQAAKTAENLAAAFDDSRNMLPPDLRGAFEIMRRNVVEGDAKNYRVVVDPVTGQRSLIPTGSSYEQWFKKRFYDPPFKSKLKDKQGRKYYKLSEKDFDAILNNMEKGKRLSDRQQWIYDTALLPAAQMIYDTDINLARESDINQLESEGYEIVGQRMSPAEFPLGHDIVLPTPTGLREYTVIQEDDGKGNVVLQNQEDKLVLDPFEIREVLAMRQNPLMKALNELPEMQGVAKSRPLGTERRETADRPGGVWSPEFREAVRRARNETPDEFTAWGKRAVKDGSPTVYEIAARFGKRIEPKSNLDELFRIVHARINRNMAPMKRFSEMTDTEKEDAVNGDFLTGLRGKRAWEIEDARLKNVVAIDLDALKWVNDNLGHDAGDAVLMLFGDAMRASGLNPNGLYHVSGDEYYMQDDDPVALDAAMEQLQLFIDNNPITVYIDGRPIDYRIEFSYGRATNVTEAEDALQLHKAARENEGSRAERGEIPPQIAKQLAERYNIRYSGSQVSEDQIAAAKEKYSGRRIQAAAIRLPTGRIVTGPSHLDAVTKLSNTELDYSPLIDGFVTDTGTFLVRELAAAIVNEPTMDSADVVGRHVSADLGRRFTETFIDSIPIFATVKRPAIHEKTGKRIEITDSARDVLREYDSDMETFYELLGCVT